MSQAYQQQQLSRQSTGTSGISSTQRPPAAPQNTSPSPRVPPRPAIPVGLPKPHAGAFQQRVDQLEKESGGNAPRVGGSMSQSSSNTTATQSNNTSHTNDLTWYKVSSHETTSHVKQFSSDIDVDAILISNFTGNITDGTRRSNINIRRRSSISCCTSEIECHRYRT